MYDCEGANELNLIAHDLVEFKNKCMFLQLHHVVYFLTCRGKLNHEKMRLKHKHVY